MARPVLIPVSEPGKLPGGNAVRAAQGSLPVDRSSITGGAFDDVAAALQSYAQGVRQQEDLAEGLRVSQAEDRFALDLATRISELDPTAETYAKDVQTAVGELTRSTLETTGIRGERRRVQLQDALSRQGTKALIGSLEVQKAALQERAATQFTEQAQGTLNRILANPAGWDAEKTEFLNKMAPALDALPQDARHKLVKGFLDEAVLKTAFAYARGKDFAGARAFLAQNAGTIDADKVMAVGYQIDGFEAEHEREVAQAEAARRTAAREAAMAAQEGAEWADAARGDVDWSNLPTGFYEGEEHRAEAEQLRTIATNRAGLTKAEVRSRANAVNNYIAGQSLSPKEADVVFDSLVRQSVKAGMDPAEAMQLAGAQMVRQVGQVPPAIKTRIAQASRSTDPTTLTSAVLLHQNIAQATPWAADTDTGLSDRGRAVLAEAQARGGGVATPELVEQAAADLASVPAADIVKRQRDAETMFAGSGLKDLQDLGGPADPAAARLFQEERRRLFAAGNSPEVATQAALAKAQATYRTTYVGGERQVRGPAPEHSYPRDVLNTLGPEWVASHIAKEVEAAGGAGAILQPDDVTRREAAEGKSPSYPVMVPVPDAPGAYRPLYAREGGKLKAVRWSGPASEAEAWASPALAEELAKRRAEVGRVSETIKNRAPQDEQVPSPEVLY